MGIKTINEQEKPYKFSPLDFFGFKYNKYGKYFEKDTSEQISIFWQNEFNKKWIFQKYIKPSKTASLHLYDLEFKVYTEAEAFLFRNGVIKCD